MINIIRDFLSLIICLSFVSSFAQSDVRYFNHPYSIDFPVINYTYAGKDFLLIQGFEDFNYNSKIVEFNSDNSVSIDLVQNLTLAESIGITSIDQRQIGTDFYLIGSMHIQNKGCWSRIKYNPSNISIIAVDTFLCHESIGMEISDMSIGNDSLAIIPFQDFDRDLFNITKYNVYNNQIIDTFTYRRSDVFALKALPDNEFLSFSWQGGFYDGLRTQRFNAFNQIIDTTVFSGIYPDNYARLFTNLPNIFEFKNENYVFYLEDSYAPPAVPPDRYFNVLLQKTSALYDTIYSQNIIEDNLRGFKSSITNGGFINDNDEFLYLIYTSQNPESIWEVGYGMNMSEIDANKVRVTKTDGENIIWKKDFGLPGKFHFVTKSFKAVDGSLIIAGSTQEDGNYFYNDPFILKIDTAGNPIFLTGVKDLEANKNGFTIYPNPTENTLQTSLAFKSFRIFDQSGRFILQANKNENQIDVSALKPGLYFLNIENLNGQQLTEKFVKM